MEGEPEAPRAEAAPAGHAGDAVPAAPEQDSAPAEQDASGAVVAAAPAAPAEPRWTGAAARDCAPAEPRWTGSAAREDCAAPAARPRWSAPPAREGQLAAVEAAPAGLGRRAELASAQGQRALDSPRTKQACRKLGLVLEDLQYRAFESFYLPGDIKERQQMRFDHFEKKRKDRLAQVLAERAKAIAGNAKRGDVPGAQSAQFLGILEGLFEKEAKRLETDLKGQLRQHNVQVKENEEQLMREDKLQARLMDRERRRDASKTKYADASQRAKEKVGEKQAQCTDRLGSRQQEHEEKQAAYARELAAEEIRLERFLEGKRAIGGDKAAVFRERVKEMKAKSRQMMEERRLEGEQRLMLIEERLSGVQQRREGEQQKRLVRSEEQHLRIIDARENKERLERVESQKRDELREQLDTNLERIETLLALKDQLLDQRKGRNLKAEAAKGSRGMRLNRDCIPGPGQYEVSRSCLNELPVGTIPTAKVPGMFDEAIRGTIDNPAPGAYNAKVSRNGDRMDNASGIGKFKAAEKTSFLDEAVRSKADVPGPNAYDCVKSTLDTRTTKMSRDRMAETTTAADKFSAKRLPTWIRPAADTPGPAGYSVDEYTRKEVLRRAQKSLPNLTRDFLRSSSNNIAVH